ncbi:MAG: hypothetical protein AAGL69_02945 [Pseudomonadota bacterium]
MISCAGFVYAACVALYEANPRRATSTLASRLPNGTRLLRYSALGLIALSVIILGLQNSFEKAVPIVIGLVAFAGIVCILVADFFPNRLAASAWATIAGGAFLFVLTAVGVI